MMLVPTTPKAALLGSSLRLDVQLFHKSIFCNLFYTTRPVWCGSGAQRIYVTVTKIRLESLSMRPWNGTMALRYIQGFPIAFPEVTIGKKICSSSLEILTAHVVLNIVWVIDLDRCHLRTHLLLLSRPVIAVQLAKILILPIFKSLLKKANNSIGHTTTSMRRFFKLEINYRFTFGNQFIYIWSYSKICSLQEGLLMHSIEFFLFSCTSSFFADLLAVVGKQVYWFVMLPSDSQSSSSYK